jgi:putative glutamine amidotransferase
MSPVSNSYRPTIGLTTQTLHSIDGIPPALPSSWVMNQRYFHAATAAGAVPWMIPLLDDDLPTLRAIYDRLDGVLIPGGVDINPAEYGEAVRPECGNLDPARDLVELQLVRWAIEEGKPVLGLCRGLQIINVSQGGTMWQDLASQNPIFNKHDYFPTAGFEREHLAHEVDIIAGTRLSHILESTRSPVNSMHHQGIKTLGHHLAISATADDGLIEAVETTGEAFCVGVQWHPEVFEMTDAHTRQLFGAFIEAASTWAAANSAIATVPRAGVGG